MRVHVYVHIHICVYKLFTCTYAYSYIIFIYIHFVRVCFRHHFPLYHFTFFLMKKIKEKQNVFSPPQQQQHKQKDNTILCHSIILLVFPFFVGFLSFRICDIVFFFMAVIT